MGVASWSEFHYELHWPAAGNRGEGLVHAPRDGADPDHGHRAGDTVNRPSRRGESSGGLMSPEPSQLAHYPRFLLRNYDRGPFCGPVTVLLSGEPSRETVPLAASTHRRGWEPDPRNMVKTATGVRAVVAISLVS